jgi:flagellar biosynthesis protein FlhG
MTSVPPVTRRSRSECIAITGSKGGVGKSNLAVNLAVSLGRRGRRVLLVDGDLGLANVDILLGLVPTRTVEDFLHRRTSLEDLVVDGPRGVSVLPAASGVPRLARLEREPRELLLEGLARLSSTADDVLVDTGAGLGDMTLALQLAASRVIVVTTPEPTSLVDAYASLKVLWAADPDRRIDLVVSNATSDSEATQAHRQIARASRHFLHREPAMLGAVYHDARLVEAVRRQRAVLDLDPDCPAARCYERIATRISMQPAPDTGSLEYWNRLASAQGVEMVH